MANPLFGHSMRDERRMMQVLRMWDPPPPNPFLGGWQPLASRKNPPILLDVDSPPGYTSDLWLLEPADRAAYFRAQRWPRNKVIVSVDNPPPQDDGRIDALGAIYNAWNAPPTPAVQSSAQSAALIRTLATGGLLSAGVGTSTFNGSALAAGALTSAGSGTDSWVGRSDQNRAPKTPFQAHIIRQWNVTLSILPTPAFSQQPSATSGALYGAGSGTASWVGTGPGAANTVPKTPFQIHIVRSWNIPVSIIPTGSLTQQFLATSGAVSSVGAGTASFVGAALQSYLSRPIFQHHIIRAWDDSRVLITAAAQQGIPAAVPKTSQQLHIIRAWDVPASIPQRRSFAPQVAATQGAISSQGLATAIWVGSSAQNTAPRIVIQNQIIGAWALQQLLLQPRRFLPQPAVAGAGALRSLGVGLVTWVGAETAAGALSSAGSATARFFGRRSEGQRFDGWRPRHEILERRRRKDEQEIAAVLAAVLPIIQSGTVRSPTRISVPRNGRTTLQ